MATIYRPARLDDLERADALVVRSANDLTERHGYGPTLRPSPPRFQTFSLQDDPSGLWVAENGGEMLGFAFSWVCGDLWFLAQLFVSPGHQGSGLGSELLKRALPQAHTAGAMNKALITFAFNTVSQGLYIRHGLYPRVPLYLCSASRELLHGQVEGECLRWGPLTASTSHLRELARIDVQALGLPRDKHHRFLIDDDGISGFILYAGDKCVGYAYVSSTGHIGPLAASQPDAMGAAFRTALTIASKGKSSTISALLPGVSEPALDLAIHHGMRITVPMVLMAARDFADWRLYLPRNPGFM